MDEALGHQVDEVPASVGAPVLAPWAAVHGLGGQEGSLVMGSAA